MNINFNFTLSETDTQNFLDILQDAIAESLEKKLDAVFNENQELATWHDGHTRYLQQLKKTIKSSAIYVD